MYFIGYYFDLEEKQEFLRYKPNHAVLLFFLTMLYAINLRTAKRCKKRILLLLDSWFSMLIHSFVMS